MQFLLQTRDVPIISTGEPLPTEALLRMLDLTSELLKGNDTVFFRKVLQYYGEGVCITVVLHAK